MIVRGQLDTMHTSFIGLLGGLVFAIVLVYLLIVVNFQSWLDPFIIITALPAALAGIVLILFLTHTTLSVPALMGAIMCMGVATANSILVVSFAKEQLIQHGDPVQAALNAGGTRFRPVLMTALAMIIGMVPMALGLGEGGEQNAPLGRAVIGGLLWPPWRRCFLCRRSSACCISHRGRAGNGAGIARAAKVIERKQRNEARGQTDRTQGPPRVSAGFRIGAAAAAGSRARSLLCYASIRASSRACRRQPTFAAGRRSRPAAPTVSVIHPKPAARAEEVCFPAISRRLWTRRSMPAPTAT